MSKQSFDPKVLDLLKKLEDKYETMGQDLASYLDGLLYSDYLTYWDYIHLDTLLSLQNPKTNFPDEKIFIIYHQITELYFRLILHEQSQAIFEDGEDPEVFYKRLKRITRYFQHLSDSFDVMIDGMDQEQFLAFRMSLLPSSGFQSAQYRLIEIHSTDLYHLLDKKSQEQHQENDDLESLMQNLYWKKGATELATGKKTLTLRQFEKKYHKDFLETARKTKGKNLRQKYLSAFIDNQKIEAELRNLDYQANVQWPLAHLKSAAKYLQKDPEVIKATGGTNWQKYLPPRRQVIVYFPELWSEQEIEHWGIPAK
jgi:tryptophan 2,3-dioxygenase